MPGKRTGEFFTREGGFLIRLEIIVESDPYRTILCRIPIDQREQFLNCIDLMPGMMEYVGRTDYADYCMGITSEFYRILMTEGEPLMKPDCNSFRLN